MILNNEIGILGCRLFTQSAQSVCSISSHLFSCALSGSIYANGVTADRLSNIYPCIVIFYRFCSLCFIGISQIPQSITHDLLLHRVVKQTTGSPLRASHIFASKSAYLPLGLTRSPMFQGRTTMRRSLACRLDTKGRALPKIGVLTPIFKPFQP